MIRETVEKYIRKTAGTLKSETELAQILKARFTKREYKILLGWAEGVSVEKISERLKLDSADYEVLSKKIVKKLNQEKLNQEISG